MITIREMTPEDYDQKGFVHYKAWQETYTGLMPESFLAKQTLEKCQNIARRWPENTFVAELDGRIVGFSCYGTSRDSVDANAGEVYAIYILAEAQGFGIGRKLMDAALARLAGCSSIILWVLKSNDQAIGFYQHYGFYLDCAEKTMPLGTELRMLYRKS